MFGSKPCFLITHTALPNPPACAGRSPLQAGTQQRWRLVPRWSQVAKYIPGRTGQQCAQRWRHRVNPNIKKEKWTLEEDRLLMRLVHRHGSAWAEIARGLEVRASDVRTA